MRSERNFFRIGDGNLEVLDNPQEILSANIRARLETLGWKVLNLAAASGIGQSYVYEIVRGDKWPSAPYLKAISKALGISVPELLTERSADSPAQKPLHALVNPLFNSQDVKWLAEITADDLSSLRAFLLSLRAMRRAKLVKKSV